jgi:hypothetical protein
MGVIKMIRNSLNPILRKQIYERDNHQYQKCGQTDIDHLVVHHIEPYFISQNDDPENLVTLCEICHLFVPNTKEEFEEFIKVKENLLEKAKALVSQNKLNEAWDILKIVKNNEKERSIKGLLIKNERVAAGLDTWKMRGPDKKKRNSEGYIREQARITPLA